MALRYGTIVVFVLNVSLLVVALKKPDDNPDIDLKTVELATKYGYPLEVHRVVTLDGYILELHRIPYGRQSYQFGPRPAVLLQHGLAGSSADWVIMGPGRALAYILADEGYDVWLGNNRGNIYSRNHTYISTTDRAFWNFSYHELGIYDLPAMTDYILERTGNRKIRYVGHSQGTTQFWVLCSTMPAYNDKFALMVGLAPAAFTGNIRGPVTTLAKLTYFGLWVGQTFGYPEFGSRSPWGKFVSNLFCQNASPTQFVCSNILFSIAGFSYSELNKANLTVIIGHVPAGASWKQFVHFGQGYINPGLFRQFDYGEIERNYEVYGLPEPPEYKLENVVAPVALFHSEGDWLATPKDVQLLRLRLNSVVFDREIPRDQFNHYDFIWGRSSVETVFRPMMRLLGQYR